MLTTQQCALLKAQVKQHVVDKPSTKPKEVVVTMKSAFQQFTITQYNQSK
jgi:hypothetical protein